jgi:hypothetical protein
MIVRSNGNLGMMGRGKPPNALRAKRVEKKEDDTGRAYSIKAGNKRVQQFRELKNHKGKDHLGNLGVCGGGGGYQ